MNTKDQKRIVKKYLESEGYRIIDNALLDEFDMCAKKDDVLVLIDVDATYGDGFNEENINRPSIERMMSRFSINNLDLLIDGTYLRYDTVSLHIVSDTRAIVRHHVNALGPSYE